MLLRAVQSMRLQQGIKHNFGISRLKVYKKGVPASRISESGRVETLWKGDGERSESVLGLSPKVSLLGWR